MIKIEKKALLLSLFITIILTGLLIYYLNTQSVNTGPMVKVVVALTNIPSRTVIKEEQLNEVYIPQKYAAPNYISNKSQVVGKVPNQNIYSGEQILKAEMITGTEPDELAAMIPSGYRAITINTDSVSNVNGHIKTGDYIDILVYLKAPYSETEVIKTAFQNIKVLDSGKGSQQSSCITLCMTPVDAEKLFLIDSVGKIRLVLKQTSDREPIYVPEINANSIT